MFKKIFNKFLDYVSYVILGLFGLLIFKFLYYASFTEVGSAILIILSTVITLVWAFIRAFKK